MSAREPRLSQIMPTVRCTDCGKEVEFRLLGEHVCSSAPAMPVLPVKALQAMHASPSSGAYKPGYKPPPIPIASQTPNGLPSTPAGPTTSPGRPSTASSRPALPFLEKYSKKNKSGATTPGTPPTPSAAASQSQQNGYGGSNGNGNGASTSLTGSPLTSSPTTPTGPSQSLNGGGYSGHHSHHQYQQQQQQPPARDYFSRTATGPMGEDRFEQSPPGGSGYLPYQQQQQQPRSKTPNGYDEGYNSNGGSGRARTPNQMDIYSTSPTGSRTSQQPAVPQKSNARAPSVASAHGLGISQGPGSMENLRSNMRSPVGDRSGGEQQRPSTGRERSSSNASRTQTNGGMNGRYAEEPATAPLPSLNGSGSMDRHLRDRSNTVQSERSIRSDRSDRSGRREEDPSASSRSRYPDQASSQLQHQGSSSSSRSREGSSRTPDMSSSSSSRMMTRDNSSSSLGYKNPSPPTSPEDVRTSEQTMSDARSRSKPSYRPPTPPDASSPVPSNRGRRPSRKPSGDQFDAMMDNLMQDINDMSTGPSVRDSSRPASAHRSRSRPNLRSEGSSRDMTGSPPPTPGLPHMGGNSGGSGSSSIRSYRGDRSERERGDRSERDRERAERDRGDRGEREHRSERGERSDRDRERERRERERGERSERGEREHRSERGAERERSEREHRSDRSDRERERERGRSYDASKVSSSGRSSTRSRSTNRRGGITHCEGCKHDIEPHEADKAIKMQMGDYHPECFKCQRCRRPIENPRAAHEYDGRLLCEKDYARVLEKEAARAQRRTAVCAACDQPIQSSEQPIYALGQAWHEHHLSCYHCHNPIDRAVGHVEKNGRVYCPKDFGSLFLPKCRACGLPVEKEAVCAQDGKLKGKWHAACFGCQTCKKPFPDKSFYVYGDAPYCRRHYHKLNNSLCKGCDQPIEGPCAQTMEGWRFHPNCFSCVECKTPLSDVYYNFENQAYCEKDILIIQKTRNVRAERRKTFFGKV